MLQRVSVSYSFLLLNRIPLYGYITFYALFTSCWIVFNSDCFHCLAIKKNASTYIHIHVFVCTYIFISLGQILRSGMSGFCKYIFNILINCQSVFQVSAPFYFLTCHVLVSLHPYQCLELSVFFIIVILVSVQYYSISLWF